MTYCWFFEKELYKLKYKRKIRYSKILELRAKAKVKPKTKKKKFKKFKKFGERRLVMQKRKKTL